MNFKNKTLKSLISLLFFLPLSCGEESTTIDALLSKTESSSQTVSGRAQNTLDALADVEQTFTVIVNSAE